MSWGALARTSPSSPVAAGVPSSLTSLSSTPGMGEPSVSARSSSRSSGVAMVRIGASVRP